MSDAGKAVFLSYASQDAEAAKRICEALRAAGIEVWFDQSELVGGDAWDGKIRKQIKECALLIPVISQNTQARTEGYFRLEWRLAEQRTHLMAKGRPFLVPVVIDDTKDSAAHVPDAFLEVQWTRLPGGEATPAFCARLRKLLGGSPESAGEAPRAAGGSGPIGALAPRTRRWRAPAIGLVVVAAGTLAWMTLAKPTPRAEKPAAAAVAPLEPIVARVTALLAKTDVMRTELDLLEATLAAGAQSGAGNAAVFAAWARVDERYMEERYDSSDSRRESLRRHAAQAMALAPRSFAARFVRTLSMSRLAAGSKTELLQAWQELAAEEPGRPEVLVELAWAARNAGHTGEALATLRQVEALPNAAATGLFNRGLLATFTNDFATGIELFRAATEREPAVKYLLWRSYLETIWLGDPPAARRTLARVPAEYFLEDMPAAAKYFVEFRDRDFGAALATMRAIPRDYLQAGAGSFATGHIRGLALAMMGKSAAAESEWRQALAAMEKRLAADPNDAELLVNRAVLLAALGDHAAAERVWNTVTELYGPSPGSWATLYYAYHQYSPEKLLAWLTENSRQMFWFSAAELRLDPLFDKIRGEPAFAALLAQAEADPKRSPKAVAAAGPAVDAKSVAVLAFANLSDDKANEYFSDGISEELLNVLAKVPGLKVCARTSAFYFKGKEVPVPEIARQLGVAYVVEGSVQRAGDHVKIAARLTKAADGFQVWSDSFHRDAKDVFAVEEEIAGLIAKNLALKLAGTGRAAKTVDPEAHRLLLEGQYHSNLRGTEELALAEKKLRQALELDPGLAVAHAALAEVHVVRANFDQLDGLGGGGADLARAEAEARAATALDPTLAAPHSCLGFAYLLDHRWDEAELAFRRALDLEANNTLALRQYQGLLQIRGRTDLARAAVAQALDVDPLSFIALVLQCVNLAEARRFDEALAMSDRAEAVNARPMMMARGIRAEVLFGAGRADQAVALAREILRTPGARPRALADCQAIRVLQRAGLREEAAGQVEALGKRWPPDSPLRGFALAALGRFDEAWPFLEKTSPLALHALYWHEMFDGVRDTPRFQQLIAKLGCTEEYRVARVTFASLQK